MAGREQRELARYNKRDRRHRQRLSRLHRSDQSRPVRAQSDDYNCGESFFCEAEIRRRDFKPNQFPLGAVAAVY
jgi:hypothetical protein